MVPTFAVNSAIDLGSVRMLEKYVSKLAVKQRRRAAILVKSSAMRLHRAAKTSLARTRRSLHANANI